LALSVAIHAALITGIGFAVTVPALQPVALLTLEVTLAPASKKPPTANALGEIPTSPPDSLSQNRLNSALATPSVDLAAPAKSKLSAQYFSEQNQNVVPSSTHEANEAQHLLVKRYREEIDALQKGVKTLERETFINATTDQDEYSAYMARWRKHVEVVGNRHATDQPELRKQSGGVLLAVSLTADGSVQSVKLLNSSGQNTLDQAAQKIARLAAPYEAFPDSIQAKTDVLHITRTWQFTPAGTSVAR
jgi:periplasmic protein TonB